MISFVPESLQADIIESINDLHFLKGNIEEIEFSVFQKLEESADEYDCEISENSMVCLSVGEDDFPLISVREFLDMAKCKAHLKINDAQSCVFRGIPADRGCLDKAGICQLAQRKISYRLLRAFVP